MTKTTLEKQLHDIGLNASETKVYLYLLENAVASPPQISRGTSIARSNAHYALRSLEEKNLIKRQQKGKRFVYIPTDPSTTLQLLERKKKAMKETLPELKALYKSKQHKPSIKFYEGSEQLVEIFESVLETKHKEVLGFASTERLFKLIPDYFQKRFQKELKKREIFLRDILSHASGERVGKEARENTRPYYDYKVLDKKWGDLPTDILVWDDKVAVMTLEEPVFGTVLQDKRLADTYRVQFKIMWNSLPRAD